MMKVSAWTAPSSPIYSVEPVSKRETSKPRWGLVTNTFRAVNQRGEEVLVFSSAVLIAKRAEDT